MSFARILAPIDFSDDSRASAALAVTLAGPGGEVVILHVDPLPDLGAAAAPGDGILHALGEHLRARFAVQLDELLEDLHLRSPATTAPAIRGESRSGDPVEVICAVAATWPAELIVIGAHGESGSVRFLFGGTTAKVTRLAPCPVLVTRPGHAEQIAAAGAPHRVLVAVDYSPFSAVSAELAARMLAPGGSMTLIHVWHSPGNLPLAFTGDRRNVAIDRLQEFAAGLDLRGASVELLVDVGSPALKILAQAERMHADLVVVGAHGHETMVEKILGSVADRVLRHADAPVLLLPEGALAPADRRRAREDRAPH